MPPKNARDSLTYAKISAARLAPQRKSQSTGPKNGGAKKTTAEKIVACARHPVLGAALVMADSPNGIDFVSSMKLPSLMAHLVDAVEKKADLASKNVVDGDKTNWNVVFAKFFNERVPLWFLPSDGIIASNGMLERFYGPIVNGVQSPVPIAAEFYTKRNAALIPLSTQTARMVSRNAKDGPPNLGLSFPITADEFRQYSVNLTDAVWSGNVETAVDNIKFLIRLTHSHGGCAAAIKEIQETVGAKPIDMQDLNPFLSQYYIDASDDKTVRTGGVYTSILHVVNSVLNVETENHNHRNNPAEKKQVVFGGADSKSKTTNMTVFSTKFATNNLEDESPPTIKAGQASVNKSRRLPLSIALNQLAVSFPSIANAFHADFEKHLDADVARANQGVTSQDKIVQKPTLESVRIVKDKIFLDKISVQRPDKREHIAAGIATYMLGGGVQCGVSLYSFAFIYFFARRFGFESAITEFKAAMKVPNDRLRHVFEEITHLDAIFVAKNETSRASEFRPLDLASSEELGKAAANAELEKSRTVAAAMQTRHRSPQRTSGWAEGQSQGQSGWPQGQTQVGRTPSPTRGGWPAQEQVPFMPQAQQQQAASWIQPPATLAQQQASFMQPQQASFMPYQTWAQPTLMPQQPVPQAQPAFVPQQPVPQVQVQSQVPDWNSVNPARQPSPVAASGWQQPAPTPRAPSPTAVTGWGDAAAGPQRPPSSARSGSGSVTVHDWK
jgi:hypothetical protein